uniref:Uncharacterized protein n=1 Tax=Pristionchus pacificus TaxID=54126 RepID=A0A2A6C0M9_PRIPA|eukprot:PDM71669.1 hypothetical protein PRIPAC_38076 [Pristionchus pacificus]
MEATHGPWRVGLLYTIGIISGLLILKGPIVRKRSQRLNNLVFVVFVFAMSIRTRTHPVTGRLQFGFAVSVAGIQSNVQIINQESLYYYYYL